VYTYRFTEAISIRGPNQLHTNQKQSQQ